MQFVLKLLKKYFKKSPPKLVTYLTLDELPIWNWWEINKTGNAKHLLKEFTDVDKSQLSFLDDLYRSMLNDFIKKHGLSDGFKNIILKKLEITGLKADLIITGDRIIETFIDICNFELAEMVENQSDVDLGKVKANLDKQMGFRIDLKTVSVNEFYAYLEVNGKG